MSSKDQAPQKPAFIQEIEKILGKQLFLSPPAKDGGLRRSFMGYKKDQPKYAMDGDKLVGLNLTQTGLTNSQWQAILKNKGLDLKYLQALSLGDNQLTTFAPLPSMGSLSQLNLSRNKLREFRLIPECTQLEKLYLDGNKLSFPPPEMVKQGNEAMLRYLKELIFQGERDVYEVKMLIVGEGGTGKTTLWNKLQDIEYPVPLDLEEQPSTVGIEIEEGWTFDHLNVDRTKFLVNLWDFGGQNIQYMTHQFFLTRRSFYVLMADGRREVANFSYWFKIINLLGVDPEESEKLPVLIVLNEKGNPISKMPYDPIKDSAAFPALRLIDRKVDFKNRKDGRIEALIKSIQEILCNSMAHLPLTIPKLWDEVRRKLANLKAQEVNYIKLAEFQKICKDSGLTDNGQMEDLSQFLHDLGIILHYQDDFRVGDFVVLNPQWAVDGVYEVLRHSQVADDYGRFDEALLRKIWKDRKFTIAEQGYLMNLMLKDSFEVCFETFENDRKIYISPQLLPDVSPKYEWNPGKYSLQYIYQYPFMPKGLIGRLMVRLHEYIQTQEGKKIVWDKGMLLERNDSTAMVEETQDKKTGGRIIKIEVAGEHKFERRHLLQIVRDQLVQLKNRSFPALEYSEQIPCCCPECLQLTEPHFFDQEALDRRLRKNVLFAPCEVSFENVKIKDLLEGIELDPIERKSHYYQLGLEKKYKKETEKQAIKIFFSYSKHDKAYLDMLKKQLSSLRRGGTIADWDDSKLIPGEEWDEAIQQELDEADIILLLLSPDAIATDYIWDIEMKKAMEKDARSETSVIPIFLRPCDWEELPLAKNAGLPAKGQYISQAEDKDQTWLEVVQGIKKVINSLQAS